MTRIAAIALLVLLGPGAAADDTDKATKPWLACEKRDPAKPREPGLLRFEDLGVCQDAQRTPPPWEGCGDCGFLKGWDDRLQVWRPQGR